MRSAYYSKALLFAGLLSFQAPAVMAAAIPVELRSTEQGWQLLRDGKPYLIKGAGGSGSLAQLAAAGGNSIRTWSTDDIGPALDEAQSLGLSVAVGIWLGHERHGFDYGDPEQVKAQFERARQAVLTYKDHPAVLLWGIGNEMEGFGAGDDPAIWRAVNDIASMIKELDPAHPTMTVTAEIGGVRVASVNEYCPAIDIHGINSYGGATSLAQRYRDAGGTKPYILTEFGPPGPWEVATNEWGTVREPTSAEKAASYGEAYARAVGDSPGLALGSYAFTWGFKMEATATWFGMFLNDGARLAATDTMQEIWSGSPPANRAPTIAPLTIEGADAVKPHATVTVSAAIKDPEDDPLRVRWVLRPDSKEFVTGGDFRPDLPDIPDAVLESSASSVRLRMPEEPGPYRLFAYAYDDAGNAATANVPLLVEGIRRTRMPVVVYDDSFNNMPWVPSGWMGATDKLTLAGDYGENTQEGTASIKLRYTGTFGWAGVAWQHPPNNWGDQAGGFDLTGASKLTLWARGEYGGEKIKIGAGLLGENTAYPDSGIASIDNIVLTSEWQRYEIPLKNLDLSSIKTGFVVTMTGRRTPVTIYLDSIRYER